MNEEPGRFVDEFVADNGPVVIMGHRSRRSLLTGLGEYLIYLYVLCAAFIHYLPHVPGVDVNPVNIISVLLYFIAAMKSFGCRGPGLLNAALAFWLVVGTAIISSMSNSALEVFHEVSVLLTFLSMFIILGSEDVKIPLQSWIRTLLYLGIVQGIVAIGIFWMWIPAPELTGIRAFNGDRTGYILDGMFGLISEVGGFWMLSAHRFGRSVALSFCAIILGVTNAVLSGYRSYVVISIFLFLVFIAWTMMKKDWRLALIQVGIGIALIAAALVDPTNRLEAMRQRILGVREYDPSLTWRQIESAQDALVISQAPWFGSGWGLANRMRVSYLGDMPSYGHNYYTAFPARIGIPLTIYFSLSWIAVGVSAIRMLRKGADLEVVATCWYMIAITVMVAGVSVVQNVAIMSRAFPLIAIFMVPILDRSRRTFADEPVPETDAAFSGHSA